MVAVTGNATYKATYSNVVNEYTIKFVDENGTELQSSKVAYGVIPVYIGKEPRKAEDEEHIYAFVGWNPEVVAVTGDATYTAMYEQLPKTGDDHLPTAFLLMMLSLCGIGFLAKKRFN